MKSITYTKLKLVGVAVGAFLGFQALATAATTVCFNKQDKTDAKFRLPNTVCLLDVVLDQDGLGGGVGIQGEITDFFQLNVEEDALGYTLRMPRALNEGSGCEASFSSELVLTFPVEREYDGAKLAEGSIGVSAKIKESVDSCHSQSTVKTVLYTR